MPRALALSLALLVALLLLAAMPAASSGPDHSVDGEVYHADALLPSPNEGPTPVREPTGMLCCGADERVQVEGTTQFPYSAIAYLELYQGNEPTASCTGTFVGPNAVLTAAHCLYTPQEGWTTDVRVVPGANGLAAPFGSEFATEWWVPDGWVIGQGNLLYDWGIIKVGDGSLGQAVGWMTVASLRDETLSVPDFRPSITGYPADKPFITMWGAEEEAFTDVNTFSLDFTIDAAHGQSGSAIYSNNPSSPHFRRVVGVLSNGNFAFNSGTRVEDSLLDDIQTGCQIMLCSISTFEENVGPTLFAWADVDCGSSLDIGDAILIARYTIGLGAPGIGDCPALGDAVTVDGADRTWGDADCFEPPDIGDAITIARHTVFLPTTVAEDCPGLGAPVAIG